MRYRAGRFAYNLFSDNGKNIIDCDTLRSIPNKIVHLIYHYLMEDENIDFEKDSVALGSMINAFDRLNEIDPIVLPKTAKESLKEFYKNHLGIDYED